MRRHGWQRPLHPLQLVGIAVFAFLVVSFYVFLGPFLGNRILRNTILSLFSCTAFSVAVLYTRCTAIDPSDRTSSRKRKRAKSRGRLPNLNYKFILWKVVLGFFRKVENKILRSYIRRKYLDPWQGNHQVEPLISFPLVFLDEAAAPDRKDDDITFCTLCDFEWLNNCIGRKNYTTFILLMVFTLLMLTVEGASAIVIFVRCFASVKSIARETKEIFHAEIPRGVLAAISVSPTSLLSCFRSHTAQQHLRSFFSSMFFSSERMKDVVVLAMREQSESIDPFDELYSSSDESDDLDSPERPTLVSRFLCRKHENSPSTQRLSIRIEKDSNSSTPSKKAEFQIDPWKLIKMSKEKALKAAERARERMRQKLATSPLRPLPLEMKHGPLLNQKVVVRDITPVVPRSWFTNSPSGHFSSPRRRISGSPSPRPQKYRNSFDPKLTEVSRELETYISKQVLSSVIKQSEDDQSSPR